MLIVISCAVAGAIMEGSGFNTAVGIGKATGLQDDAAQLNDDSSQFRAERAGDGGSYLGLTADSTRAFVGLLKWSLMLPVALQNIGFPAWFVIPLGWPIQFINYVGIWQIIRGMKVS
ncbi:hypothetical protein C5B91_20130 [Haloferax sp. Atlit-10N]|nr:hypothetical protein [Haloferax sp. Atlit-16N]RDZ39430.1 hypothetical protein C5B87_19390 [Haloferax sp. Atlit-16N]RDZ53946.1 hypothetical protein C5B91_20130 [Haloferax sp. Atlit-10N]